MITVLMAIRARFTPRVSHRRVKWEIFPGGIRNGVGVIVTDLDTEQFAAGSARTERAARKLAAHRLLVSPSGHLRVVADRSGADTPVRRKGWPFDGVTAG